MENNITLILNALCIILAVISFRISLGVYGRNKEVVEENRNLRIKLFNYQMEILRFRKLKGAYCGKSAFRSPRSGLQA